MTTNLKTLIEENLVLLETDKARPLLERKYTPIVQSTMIKRCASLLANADLNGDDFDKYMNRLKKVEYGCK